MHRIDNQIQTVKIKNSASRFVPIKLSSSRQSDSKLRSVATMAN